MARGDLTLFEELTDQLGEKGHNFSSDTLKLGIVDNTLTPLDSIETPTWSDYSANEVTDAGGYVTGGIALTGVTWSEVDGVSTLDDSGNISLAQDALGFTDGYWGILYNDTNATKMAVAFVDLGGPVSEQDGPININWGASGIFKLTKVA